jgi:hypothetical protein
MPDEPGSERPRLARTARTRSCKRAAHQLTHRIQLFAEWRTRSKPCEVIGELEKHIPQRGIGGGVRVLNMRGSTRPVFVRHVHPLGIRMAGRFGFNIGNCDRLQGFTHPTGY